jgi:hypothetical protein
LSKAQAVAFQNQVCIITTLHRINFHVAYIWVEAFEELEEVSFDATQCPICMAEDNLRFCTGSISVLTMLLSGKKGVVSEMYRLHNQGEETAGVEDWISWLVVEVQKSEFSYRYLPAMESRHPARFCR